MLDAFFPPPLEASIESGTQQAVRIPDGAEVIMIPGNLKRPRPRIDVADQDLPDGGKGTPVWLSWAWNVENGQENFDKEGKRRWQCMRCKFTHIRLPRTEAFN